MRHQRINGFLRHRAGAGLRRHIHLSFLALLAGTLLLSSAEGAAQAPRYDLVVELREAQREGRGLPQAQVSLTAEANGIAGEARALVQLSGSDGRTTFRGLPGGSYRLTVAAPGFEPAVQLLRIPETTLVEMELHPRPLTLDEVMGTASPLRSGATYTAAQSFDQEALARRLDASIGSMLDGEAGVAMRSLGPAPARPVIRGFDGDRILVLENGERVGDIGESSADHAVALDPLAVERVEIVRGPASLLYGSGALGGVVNLRTRDLPRSWGRSLEGAAQLQGASMNRAVAGAMALTYGAQDWASTFRFSARETGDLRTPEGRIGDTSLSSRDGALGLVRSRGALHFGVSASFVDRDYGIPEAWDDPDEEVYLTMEQRSLQARVEWEPEGAGFLKGVEIRGKVSRFFQQEIERELEADGSWEAGVELEYDALSASTTATLRHGPVGVFGEGAVGLALRARKMDVGGDEAFFPGVDERSAALFTFQEAPLTRDLRLQVGGRLELNRNRTRPSPRFPAVNERREGTARSGSVGLHWDPAAGWELGAQVARAHRVPMAEELFANGPHLAAGVFEIGRAELADEVSHGVDLFVRRGGARGTLEVAAFASRIGGFVAFQPLGRIDEASGFPVFEYQGTEARMLGAELSTHLRLDEIWRVGVGVDLVRGTRADGSGEPLPAVPPFRSRIQVEADPGPWWAGTTLRAVAAQGRVAPDEFATPGYALVDAQLGVRFGPGATRALIVRVDNALDAAYRDHLSRLPDRDLLMPGRNVSVLLRWQF